MTKVRRQKRRKKFQYNVNRKRLNKKKNSFGTSGIMGSDFKGFPSTEKNFKKHGLVYDVNQGIQHAGNKKEVSETNEVVDTNRFLSRLEKAASVVEKKEINMSKDQMDYLGFLVNKYGEDYEAMAKDRRNYLQHTWRQLRHKIKTYKIVLKKHERIAEKNNKK